MAPLSLEHATLAENSADEIGGLSLLAFSGTPNTLIENSLIGDNRAGDAPDCTRSGFTVTPGGTNLLAIDDPLAGEQECLEDPPNLVGTRTDPLDPSLAPLQDNGGQTPTHGLLPGSPALDATGDQGEVEDQRGVSRPVGAGFDIGAFEGVALVPLLSATKVVQSHDPGADTVHYRIEITNGGTGPQPDDPSSEELEDVLPPELELVSATSSSPGFTVVTDLPSNTVRGNGPIGAGETVTVEILASVIVPPDTLVSNQALVRYDADVDGTNESTAPSDDPGTPEPLDPTVFPIGATVLEIPTLDTLGLLLLATTLLLITGLELRRRGPDRLLPGSEARRERPMAPPRPFPTSRWDGILILSWAVEPEVLFPILPEGLELDRWRGDCHASLVGLRLRDTRVLGLPIPLHRTFLQVNLRFYVPRRTESGWRRGVVFFRELVSRRAVALVARWVYGESVTCRSIRRSSEHPPPGSRIEFLVQRHRGGSRRRGATVEYRLERPRWRISPVETAACRGDTALYGEGLARELARPPVSAFVAEGSEVALHRPGILSD